MKLYFLRFSPKQNKNEHISRIFFLNLSILYTLSKFRNLNFRYSLFLCVRACVRASVRVCAKCPAFRLKDILKIIWNLKSYIKVIIVFKLVAIKVHRVNISRAQVTSDKLLPRGSPEDAIFVTTSRLCNDIYF